MHLAMSPNILHKQRHSASDPGTLTFLEIYDSLLQESRNAGVASLARVGGKTNKL